MFGDDICLIEQHDAGIACLAAAMRIMGIPSSYEQLFRIHASSEKTTWLELLRMAKQAGLKAKAVPGDVERLAFLPKPVILLAQCKTLWDFGFRTYDARLKSMIFRNRYSSSAMP